MARHQLQRVIAGAGIVGQLFGIDGIRISEETERGISQSVGLVEVSQFAHLSGLDIKTHVGIAQKTTTGQLRKNRERLTSRDARVVTGIKGATARLRQIAVVLSPQEVLQEAIGIDIYLIYIES